MNDNNESPIELPINGSLAEELSEEEERAYLIQARDESIRRFREMFPNGGVIESGEFLE